MKCPNPKCKKKLTLDDILFVEAGISNKHSVSKDKNGLLDFSSYLVYDANSNYFICQCCKTKLPKITELFNEGRDEDIIKLLE